LNGINGEKFIIETLDFKVNKQELKEQINEPYNKNLCPYCNNPVDDNDFMCSYCGEPLSPDLLDSQNRFNLDFLKEKKKVT
jgi:predicted amidophosphoribosyltransferase